MVQLHAVVLTHRHGLGLTNSGLLVCTLAAKPVASATAAAAACCWQQHLVQNSHCHRRQQPLWVAPPQLQIQMLARTGPSAALANTRCRSPKTAPRPPEYHAVQTTPSAAAAAAAAAPIVLFLLAVSLSALPCRLLDRQLRHRPNCHCWQFCRRRCYCCCCCYSRSQFHVVHHGSDHLHPHPHFPQHIRPRRWRYRVIAACQQAWDGCSRSCHQKLLSERRAN